MRRELIVRFVLGGSMLGLLAPGAGADPLEAAAELYQQGDLADALAAYHEIAGDEATDREGLAIARNNACAILNSLARYPEALEECRSALRLRRELQDEWRIARTLNNLGWTLELLGEFGQANLAYREALEINERLGDLEGQIINRSNLGLVATSAGRYAEALELFAAAEATASAHPGEPWSARQVRLARLNQGVALEKLGAHREALEINRRLVADPAGLEAAHLAAVQVNLGVMYRNLGDPMSAVAAFEAAAGVYEELGDRAGLSNATLNLALAWHLNLGRPLAAESAYREALALARSSGDRSEEIQDLFYLGAFMLEQGRAQAAEELFGLCLEVSEAAGSAEGRWSAFDGLGRVALEGGDLRQALARFDEAISEVEAVRRGVADRSLRAGFFGDKRRIYEAAVAVLGRLAAAEPEAGWAARAFDVVQKAKTRELVDALGGKGAAASPLDAEAIERRVRGRILIEYFLAEGRLYRWVAGDVRLVMRDLGPAAEILASVSEVHRRLAAGGEPGAASLAELARRLLGDLELPGAVQGWIVPDGGLHDLPFEILDLPGRGPLVEAFEVAYLPSASALGWLGGGPRPTLPLIGFGAPEPAADRGEDGFAAGRLLRPHVLPPLESAAGEIRRIAELMPGGEEIRLGSEATEAAFRELVIRGALTIHLATHTVIDEGSGGRAAIVLSPEGGEDGILVPGEIAALDYRGELTVLAACRSALGGIEAGRALTSLTGAFLAAGSSAVVATLWDTGDAATAAFMDQFYFQLARGLTPAAALRRAKLRLRADPEWGRPHLWAAFVLVGDGEAIVPRSRARLGLGLAGVVLAAAAFGGFRWVSRRRRLRP